MTRNLRPADLADKVEASIDDGFIYLTPRPATYRTKVYMLYCKVMLEILTSSIGIRQVSVKMWIEDLKKYRVIVDTNARWCYKYL